MALTNCGFESTRGTTLLRATSADGPWTAIAAIEQMPELAPTATTDTCTDPYGSGTSGWIRKYKTGEFNGGQVTFTCNWISGNAGHDLLYADFDTYDEDAEIWLRIALSDVAATTRDFPALVVGISEPLPQNGGKVQFTVTCEVNGKPIRS
jgi:hypothetical protein